MFNSPMFSFKYSIIAKNYLMKIKRTDRRVWKMFKLKFVTVFGDQAFIWDNSSIK